MGDLWEVWKWGDRSDFQPILDALEQIYIYIIDIYIYYRYIYIYIHIHTLFVLLHIFCPVMDGKKSEYDTRLNQGLPKTSPLPQYPWLPDDAYGCCWTQAAGSTYQTNLAAPERGTGHQVIPMYPPPTCVYIYSICIIIIIYIIMIWSMKTFIW